MAFENNICCDKPIEQGKNYKKTEAVETYHSSHNLLSREKPIRSYRNMKSNEAVQNHESLCINSTLIKRDCYETSAELWDNRMQRLIRKLETLKGEREVTMKIHKFMKTKSKTPSVFVDKLHRNLISVKVKKNKKTKSMSIKQSRKKKHSTVKIEIPFKNRKKSKNGCLKSIFGDWNKNERFSKYDYIRTYINDDNGQRAKKQSKTQNKTQFYGNNAQLDSNDTLKQKIFWLLEKWVYELSIHMFLDVDTLDCALIDFVDEIINTIKGNTVLTESHVQYLQSKINEWVTKITGKNYLLTKEPNLDLIMGIQNCILQFAKLNDCRNLRQEINGNYYSNPRQLDFEQLSIDNSLYQTPSCVSEQSFTHSYTEDLVENIEKESQRNTHEKEIIDDKLLECNIKNHFACDNFDHEKFIFSNNNSFTSKSTTVDINYLKKSFLISKYKLIINSWIDSCVLDGKLQMLRLKNQFELIHELAVKLDKIQDDAITCPITEYNNAIERIISEQFLQNDIHVCFKHKFKLITAIRSNCFDSSPNDHTLYADISLALENWVKTSSLYKNVTVNEIKRLKQIIQNFAQSLYQCSNNQAIYSQILQYICMLYKRNRIDDHIKKHAVNLKEFLDKLNLFTNKNTANTQIVRSMDRDKDPNMNTGFLKNPVTVYGFTMANGKKKNKLHISDDKVYKFKSNANENIKSYAKLLDKEIYEWIDGLNILQMHDRGLKQVAATNIAEDIIDRQNYLKLHPESKGTDKTEEENIKYQIFKWINKLTGEDNQETVKHASELIQRIRNIPFSFPNKCNKNKITETHQVHESDEKKYTNEVIINLNYKNVNSECPDNKLRKIESKSKNITEINSYPKCDNENDNQSFQHNELEKQATTGKSQAKQGQHQNQTSTSLQKEQGELQGITEDMTLLEVYDSVGQILNRKLLELPLSANTDKQAQLANLARKGMYNGIWKTYFTLKVDPEITKDIKGFEIFFDKRIDDMLDCLPQTKEMVDMRHEWKDTVLKYIFKMLQYEQTIIGTPSFRRHILYKFDSKLFKDFKGSKDILQLFARKVADAFILYTRYKDADTFKSKIYKWQFMKKLKELVDILNEQKANEFFFLNSAQYYKLAFDILQSVPIPNRSDLIEEADEILMEQDIEEWYKTLPTISVDNDNEKIFQQRNREILAKRLCYLEKQIEAFGDPSLKMENILKDKILQYLEKEVTLQQADNLKTKYMIEDLINRIKRRRQQNTLDYEMFRKDNSVSSNFIETDNAYLYSSLGNVESNKQTHNNLNSDQALQYDFINNNKNDTNANNADFFSGSNQAAGHSHRKRLVRKLTSHSQEQDDKDITQKKGNDMYAKNWANFKQEPACNQGVLGVEKTTEEFQHKIPIIKVIEPDNMNSSSKLVGTESTTTHHKMNIPIAYMEKQDIGNRKRNQGLASDRNSQTQTNEYANTDVSKPSRSTARIGTNTYIPGIFRNDEADVDDFCDKQIEMKYKCHCMKRIRKYRKLRYCDEMHLYPFPCYAIGWPGVFFW